MWVNYGFLEMTKWGHDVTTRHVTGFFEFRVQSYNNFLKCANNCAIFHNLV